MPQVLQLDPHTVNQIAAGEVVERPASVVKELIENALDAGATRIEIELRACGRERIEVKDNGCGMSPEDAARSLSRHATSKIRSADDLWHVGTLGFRGEALPSIASVSRFSLATAEADGARTLLRVEGGQAEPIAHDAGPRGTVISVEDLFYNVPARLKFLKSDTTELGQILDHVSRYAVAYPAVAFRLRHNGQEALMTAGDGDALGAIAAVWGREVARSLAEVRTTVGGLRLSGFVSPPHVTKANRSFQYLFVNGRPVRSRQLTTAVDVAFRDLTPDRRFPLLVLNVEVDADRIDVNVSPTKSEVRFQQEGQAFDAIRIALKGALMEHGMLPSAEQIAVVNRALAESGASSSNWLAGGGVRYGLGDAGAAARLAEPLAPFDASLAGPFGAVLDGQRRMPGLELAGSPFGEIVTGAPGLYGNSAGGYADYGSGRLGPSTLPDSLPGSGLGSEFGAAPRPGGVEVEGGLPGPAVSNGWGGGEPMADGAVPFSDLLDGLRIVGQVMKTFIVAETRIGMILIDQHVAHERILFEYLCGVRGRSAIEKQRLLVPLTLELDRRSGVLLGEKLDEIRAVGFEIEPFGGDATGGASFVVRAVPAALRGKDPIRLLKDLVDELVDSSVSRRLVPTREQIWITCACKMSIKAGDHLSQAEMEKLVYDLAQTENPYLCPHGRPITVTLGRDALHRLFKR